MERLHFLNVLDGDCTIIQHSSTRNTVIDVCNGNSTTPHTIEPLPPKSERSDNTDGNYGQKDKPVSPISYMSALGINGAFRFILTHPDMDHMDGIKRFFETHKPRNFWDIRNSKTMDFKKPSRYEENDWKFYSKLRSAPDDNNYTRLEIYHGANNVYFNKDSAGGTGDNLYVLSPTKSLIDTANSSDDYNDCSYVLLYKPFGWKVLFCGDSHNETWKHVIGEYKDDVSNVDILIAPHHGRHSDMDFSFLDTVNPKVTFFGNANSEHLAYSQWNDRGLPFVTNNQANCIIANFTATAINFYVTNPKYAIDYNADTEFSDVHNAYPIGYIPAS